MQRQFQTVFGVYLLVGTVATAVHYGLLISLVEMAGLPAGRSAAFGALCGALAAYGGNRRFTFGHRGAHSRALPRFMAVAALSAAGNGALVWAGTELLGAHYLAVQALATAAVLCAGFLMNQRWTFA